MEEMRSDDLSDNKVRTPEAVAVDNRAIEVCLFLKMNIGIVTNGWMDEQVTKSEWTALQHYLGRCKYKRGTEGRKEGRKEGGAVMFWYEGRRKEGGGRRQAKNGPRRAGATLSGQARAPS